jgi:hypothetical protein
MVTSLVMNNLDKANSRIDFLLLPHSFQKPFSMCLCFQSALEISHERKWFSRIFLLSGKDSEGDENIIVRRRKKG